jgi:tetratricopeptide (TPR) repeat protein
MEALLKKNSKHGGANLLQAKFFLNEKKNHDSIGILDSLVKDYPKWAEPSFYLALAHLSLGEMELSQKAVEDALQKAPNNTKYHTLLAQLMLTQGNSDSAKKEGSIALQLDPHNLRAAMLLSQAMLQAKEFDKAVELLVKMSAQVPDNLEIKGNLGLAYLGLKNKEKATEIFTKLVELSPGDSKSLAILASITTNGDLKKATDLVKKQITKAPESGGHYLLLGDLYLKQKMLDEALGAFNKAKELLPDNPEPHLVIAAIMRQMGKIDQAISQYRELLKSQPNSGDAHMGLATLLEIQGNIPDAKKEYAETLRIKPDFAPAANNLAWLLAQEENADLGEALRLAMIAKQQFPEEPHIADTLGWIHYKRQSYSLAESQFEQALTPNPDDPVINYHLALALHGESVKDKAIARLKKALAFSGDFKERKTAENLLKQWEKE